MRRISGHTIINHVGNVLGFTSGMLWIEGKDIAIAISTNVGSMHSGEVPISGWRVASNPAFIKAALERRTKVMKRLSQSKGRL
ncbi:MAG: hypothetical protein AAF986_07920 [Pseudomonadota bacterium]